MYKRKTRDRWDLMSDYGYGWDCECSDYTYAEAKQTLSRSTVKTEMAITDWKNTEKKLRRNSNVQTYGQIR